MVRYVRQVKVTPEKALDWLKLRPTDQRKRKDQKVVSYARDMENGHWQEDTGVTIKFDENGELIDGQNRLLAVVRSQTVIRFDVAYDVPHGAMMVLDTGAARTAGDALVMSGAIERMRSSSIVRWIIMWENKIYMGQGGGYLPTNTEIFNRYGEDSKRFDAAAVRGADTNRMGIGTGSATGVAHFLFSKIDQDEADAFFDAYISGANLETGSPLLVLQRRIIRDDGLSRPEQLALFIRAWNARRSGKPWTRAVVTGDDRLNNTNFPMPR